MCSCCSCQKLQTMCCSGSGCEGPQRRNTPAIGTSVGEAGGLLDQPATISTGVPALVETHDNCEVKVPRELNEEAARPR